MLVSGPPKKRQRVVATRKKTYRKKPSLVIPRFIKTPFPALLRNQLVYAEQTTLSLTTGAYNWHMFKCNGLYDPNHTGTGHQPLYFDQLMAIYNHYTVVSSYIEATIQGAPTSHTQLTQVLYIDDDSNAATTLASALERPGARYRAWDSTVEQPLPLRIGWSAEKTFGNKTPWTDPELQGNVGADPAEMSYFTIGLADNSVQSVTYSLLVKIWYNVVWDELKTITTS